MPIWITDSTLASFFRIPWVQNEQTIPLTVSTTSWAEADASAALKQAAVMKRWSGIGTPLSFSQRKGIGNRRLITGDGAWGNAPPPIAGVGVGDYMSLGELFGESQE